MSEKGRRPDLEGEWPQILAEAMAGADSVRSLAKRYGVSESGIRKRLKKIEGSDTVARVKRLEVNRRVALNATKAEILERGEEVAARAADEDVRDMQSGVEASREILIKIRSMIPEMDQARDLKTAADTVRTTIETIRKIRGLDEPETPGDTDLLNASEEELKRELQQLQRKSLTAGSHTAGTA